MSEREFICDEMSKQQIYDMLSLNPQRSVGLHPTSRQLIVYTSAVSGGDGANRDIRRSAATELFRRPITHRQALVKLYRIGRCSDPYETAAMIRSLLSDMNGGDDD